MNDDILELKNKINTLVEEKNMLQKAMDYLLSTMKSREDEIVIFSSKLEKIMPPPFQNNELEELRKQNELLKKLVEQKNG